VITACLGGLPDRICNKKFVTAYLYDVVREIEQEDIARGLADPGDFKTTSTDASLSVKIEADGTAASLLIDYMYRPAGLDELCIYDYLMYFEKVAKGDKKSGELVSVDCH